jgi:hypothetical protein
LERPERAAQSWKRAAVSNLYARTLGITADRVDVLAHGDPPEKHWQMKIFGEMAKAYSVWIATAVEAPRLKPVVPLVRWLDSVAFFIPKAIREPFVGDLREDVAEMVATGHSRAAIWWRVCSQVAVLAVRTWLSLRRK